MKIEDLRKDLENEDILYKGYCHDCKKPVEVSITLNKKGEIEIEGGAVYKVKQQYSQVGIFFKCDACFKENRILEDYKECETYSRAIGYLRPTNQWNKGKKAEFKMRKVFTNTKGK